MYEPFTIRIDDEGVDRRTSRDHHRRAWPDLSAWFELDDQIVLLDRETGAWPIPKRILSAKAEPFREMLRMHIGAPGKKRTPA